MSAFRPSRRTRGPDRWLRLKMALFVVGALFGVAGMATENRLLVGIAIAVLAAGVLARLLPDSREEE